MPTIFAYNILDQNQNIVGRFPDHTTASGYPWWMIATSPMDGSIYCVFNPGQSYTKPYPKIASTLYRMRDGELQAVCDLSSDAFGLGNAAYIGLNSFEDLCVSKDGTVYVATDLNIIKVHPSDGASLLAGGTVAGSTYGTTGTLARFRFLYGICIDEGGVIHATDSQAHSVVNVYPDGRVARLAGGGSNGSTSGFANGSGRSALFNGPRGITCDKSGNVYVCDAFNYRIRKITPNGMVSTFTGTGTSADHDGPISTATFMRPTTITCDPSGILWARDRIDGGSGYRMCQISQNGHVTTFARKRDGDGGKEWLSVCITCYSNKVFYLEYYAV